MRTPAFREIMAVFGLLVAAGSRSHAAAPPNDAFAARSSLGSAATVTATGTTAGATLEAEENDLDSLGGASVWWKWTAPASGWVTVDTSGSAIDTVLAVMADGPTLEDAYVVGFNDESGADDAGVGTSRVVFRAVAGTEYHVAVHGFLGQQGSVRLTIRSGGLPPVRLGSLSVTPPTVDVSTAAGGVTVDVGLATDADFAEGVVVVHRPDFGGVVEIPILPAQRIAGTARDGTYRVTVPVARYAPPGTWLVEVAASDAAGREAVFGRGVSAVFEYDHVLPDGAAGLFGVANTGPVDDAAPVVVAFTRAPAAVAVSAAPATLTFSFRVVDALAGFGAATLTLVTPTGEALTALSVTSAERTTGTAQDGTYARSFQLPAGMPGGEWSVLLLVRDAAGNPALYDGGVAGEDFPLGAASGRIQVTGAPHGYRAWLFPVPADAAGAAPGEDWDQDGLSNLIEFAFGFSWSVNESAQAAGQLPAATHGQTGLVLDFRRRRDAAAYGLVYRPQFCSDVNGVGPGGWGEAPGGTVDPLDDGWERVRVADPGAGASRRFGRVRVSLAP